MRRIWVEPDELPSESNDFTIAGEAFHHAVQVCRFRVGEEFEIVCGQNQALKVCFKEIKKKSAQVEVLGVRELPIIRKPYVNLAVGVTKWSTFEDIIEKSVEMGVANLQPLLTDFSFVRSHKDWPENRSERFLKIVKSATEQCGRGPLMQVAEPMGLKEFVGQLNQKPGTVGLFAYEGRTQHGLRDEFERLKKNQMPDEVWGVIGPTGGFSEPEVAFMQKSGYPPLSLGQQILRADTACFTIISVIKYQYGLMEGI